MDLRDNHLIQLINALPQHFQFYQFGKVEMKPHSHTEQMNELSAIAFHLYGDIRAILFLIFPKELDASLYSEMGNIIASQIATQLTQEREIEVMISPPQTVSEDRIKWIMKESNFAFRRTYAHLYKNSVIPLETLVLPSPLEGVGYA